jgi:hypothetical protein
MPELNAEQRLRDVVRGIIAQAQREAAQAVLDAVEALSETTVPMGTRSPESYQDGFIAAWDEVRAAAARYGAGTPAGGDGR